MNRMRPACASAADARVGHTSAARRCRPPSISERDALLGAQFELKPQLRRCSSRRFRRRAARAHRPRSSRRAPTHKRKLESRRLADAEPGRRPRGRGAMCSDRFGQLNIARVRVGAARARHLHGRAAAPAARRRRPQPAARRDHRRTRWYSAHRGDRRPSADVRSCWRAKSAQALARRCAQCYHDIMRDLQAARRQAGKLTVRSGRRPGQPAAGVQHRLRQPAARQHRLERGDGDGALEPDVGGGRRRWMGQRWRSRRRASGRGASGIGRRRADEQHPRTRQRRRPR